MQRGFWNVVAWVGSVTALTAQVPEDLSSWSRFDAEPMLEREVAGLELEADFVTELTSATSAGTTGRYLSSMRATADLDELVGASGWQAFADFRSAIGQSVSDRIGDVSGISSLEGDATAVSELWLASEIGDSEFRVGLLDANAHFAALDSAESFLNASVGTSPTLLGIPTWPETAAGVEWIHGPDEGWQLATGIFDGSTRGLASTEPPEDASDGLYLIAEVGYRWSCGRIGLGGWHDTGTFERSRGDVIRGASGSYALAEWTPLRERRGSPQGLTFFGSVGLGEEEVSDARLHATLGALYRGPIPRRDDDSVGIMMSRVHVGTGSGSRPESTAEAFYRAQILGELAITASLQRVENAGGGDMGDDTLVAGFRMELTL